MLHAQIPRFLDAVIHVCPIWRVIVVQRHHINVRAIKEFGTTAICKGPASARANEDLLDSTYHPQGYIDIFRA